MRTAKEFRDTAWNILRGRYWWTVLAALIVGIIGGYGGGGNVSFRINSDDIQQMQNFFVRLDPETDETFVTAISPPKTLLMRSMAERCISW